MLAVLTGRRIDYVMMWRRRINGIFLFLGGVESYLESYLDESCPRPRVNFPFLGVVLGRIQGRSRTVVILWSFLVILLQILPRILPQNLLRLRASRGGKGGGGDGGG
jgi:hypothetical protein